MFSVTRRGAARDRRLETVARLLGPELRSGCGAGGSCSAARRPRGRARSSAAEDRGGGRRAGRGLRRAARAGWAKSAPVVARWLGELRAHFPSGVVRVVQQDAIDRLGIHRLLLEPEVLENVTPDVHLAATLMSLRDALPEASRQVARNVVRQVVRGHRAAARRPHARGRARRAGPQHAHRRARATSEIDWDRTIRANLRHYQPEHRTVIPERLVGHGRRRRSLAAELILVPGPEREHGRVGRPRGRAGRVARLAADAADPRDRLRHGRRRPHRRARRPGRRPVRHPARRRDRHRPGARLLPDARRPPRQDRPDPDHRPLRGRRPGLDAAPRRRACCAPACG